MDLVRCDVEGCETTVESFHHILPHGWATIRRNEKVEAVDVGDLPTAEATLRVAKIRQMPKLAGLFLRETGGVYSQDVEYKACPAHKLPTFKKLEVKSDLMMIAG